MSKIDEFLEELLKEESPITHRKIRSIYNQILSTSVFVEELLVILDRLVLPKFNLDSREILKTDTKRSDISNARTIYYYFLYQATNLSNKEIELLISNGIRTDGVIREIVWAVKNDKRLNKDVLFLIRRITTILQNLNFKFKD